MKIYKVYFTIFNTKMMKLVEAKSKEDAERVILDSVQFDKIVTNEPEVPECFKSIFGDTF